MFTAQCAPADSCASWNGWYRLTETMERGEMPWAAFWYGRETNYRSLGLEGTLIKRMHHMRDK
jgi:hypothetical protein